MADPVSEVIDEGKGGLFSRVVEVVPNVNQTLGLDPAVFKKYIPPSRDNPPCKKKYD